MVGLLDFLQASCCFLSGSDKKERATQSRDHPLTTASARLACAAADHGDFVQEIRLGFARLFAMS